MALARSDRDLPALTVLALLLGGPRHTYEMHRLMVDTHKDFVTGLPRSRYHAVDRLQRAELVRVMGTDRERGRPERTVYALTDAGRAELGERLRRLLAHLDPDATLFVAALSFLGCLTVPQARDALDARRDALAQQASAVARGGRVRDRAAHRRARVGGGAARRPRHGAADLAHRGAVGPGEADDGVPAAARAEALPRRRSGRNRIGDRRRAPRELHRGRTAPVAPHHAHRKDRSAVPPRSRTS
jgi:DNA-binding PadR family transcriptional regulator